MNENAQSWGELAEGCTDVRRQKLCYNVQAELLFSKLNKHCVDTLFQRILYHIIMQVSNFRGDLTDIAAKTN